MMEVYGSKMDETEGSYGLLQSEMCVCVGGGGGVEGGHISLRKVVLSVKHSAQGMMEVYGSKMDETGVMGVTGAIRNGRWGAISLRKVVLFVKHSAQGIMEVYGSKWMRQKGVYGCYCCSQN